MPTYSYYADYILALTYNVHKRNKSSSDGNETSTNAMCDTKKIVVTKPTAKASDDVQPPAPKSDKGMAEGIITFALWYIVIAYNYWRAQLKWLPMRVYAGRRDYSTRYTPFFSILTIQNT
ncbi:uncharacterized protein LOC113230295 isoform X1 [Hyposmocoma kahamanoa]|uniref:uncharacterized protein LOC113230295 isoform X1 n=1 Tax=Hyposmocoma kahamanoa TaxID=1477025 RepID=UPI000E6D634E|nr:uncharacterized protein LOC113230295 isoform X1 [Hyposmocoma kahamanoa]